MSNKPRRHFSQYGGDKASTDERIGSGITKGTTAVTDKGKVKAKDVIMTTHFPFINSRGLYFMKIYQRRSYVIAYSGAPRLDCTAENAGNGFYFRNYKDMLLIGERDHRTGKRAADTMRLKISQNGIFQRRKNNTDGKTKTA